MTVKPAAEGSPTTEEIKRLMDEGKHREALQKLSRALALNYTQPLLRGFRIDQTRQQMQQAVINRDNAELNLKARTTNTLAAVRAAFANIGIVHTIHGPPFMPLEGGFVQRNRIRLKNHLYTLAERYAAKRCHRIVRVADAYFNVLTQIETLASSRAEERSVKRQLDQAEKRLEVGLAPITDVHEARARRLLIRAFHRAKIDIVDRALGAIAVHQIEIGAANPLDCRNLEFTGAAGAFHWGRSALDGQLVTRVQNARGARGAHRAAARAPAAAGGTSTSPDRSRWRTRGP